MLICQKFNSTEIFEKKLHIANWQFGQIWENPFWIFSKSINFQILAN